MLRTMLRNNFHLLKEKLPSPAVVIACLALFAAIVNPADAVKKLISSKDIKKDAVTTAKIRNGAVTGPKIKDGAITKSKLASDALQAGVKGDKGDPGAKGEPGASNIETRFVTVANVAVNAIQSVSAFCQPGEKVTGGGGGLSPSASSTIYANNYNESEVLLSSPVQTSGDPPLTAGTTNGWRVVLKNTSVAAGDVRAFVLCAKP